MHSAMWLALVVITKMQNGEGFMCMVSIDHETEQISRSKGKENAETPPTPLALVRVSRPSS